MFWIFVIGLVISSAIQEFIINTMNPSYLGYKKEEFSTLPKKMIAISSQSIDKNNQIEAIPFIQDVLHSEKILLLVIKKKFRVISVETSKEYTHIVMRKHRSIFNVDLEWIPIHVLKKFEVRMTGRVRIMNKNKLKQDYTTIKSNYLDYYA